jgi:ADP-ribose pyrophosphatase
VELKLLKHTRLYEGKVFNVVVDEVEYPSGRRTIREVAEHPGGAAILAMFPDERVIFIRQHRYPFREFVTELPAGKLNRGEDPLHCAQRELGEETGYEAARWKKLLTLYTSPGFCTEVLHIYLATELRGRPAGQALEEGEQTMTVHIIPFREALAMLDRREIVDAKTVCALLEAARTLRLDHKQERP